jgi:hypothetical protein
VGLYDGYVTHEYTIAVGGRIGPLGLGRTEVRDTAIAWAADSVLAVGSDDAVSSISRGDSTFLDLGGSLVTALPADLERAKALIEDGHWMRLTSHRGSCARGWSIRTPSSDLGRQPTWPSGPSILRPLFRVPDDESDSSPSCEVARSSTVTGTVVRSCHPVRARDPVLVGPSWWAPPRGW